MSKAAQNTTAQVATATKKVTKKSDAAPAPVVVEVKAAAKAEPAKKAAKKEEKPVAAVAAPVAAAQPVAEASAQQAVEVPTVDQEIAALISTFQSQRDHAVSAIKSLQKLQKRVAKDLKEASKRKRKSAKVVDENAPKRPTIFTTPVTLKDELCAFFGKPKGFQMTPADVTKAFSAYVDEKKLKDANKGHTIHPDAALRKVLSLKEGEELNYRSVQASLYKLYILPEKKKVATA
jgi:chromatin remodeling complex protein RSC6